MREWADVESYVDAMIWLDKEVLLEDVVPVGDVEAEALILEGAAGGIRGVWMVVLRIKN